MQKVFVDTNYILRFLINNDSTQGGQVKKIFEKAVDDKIKLFSNSIVIFEIYWVLTSFYHKEKSETLKIIKDVLSLSFIFFEEKRLLMQAIKLCSSCNLELEDCYHLYFAIEKDVDLVATFDKKMIREAKDLKLGVV